MENKVIAKEYVDKNYISKDYIKKKIKILEELYKEAGEPAECNIKSTYLYHKIINYKELLEDK